MKRSSRRHPHRTGGPASATPVSAHRPVKLPARARDGAPANTGLDRLTAHLRLAESLGVIPLTVAERAAALLSAACPGWRHGRHCTDPDGLPVREPHPACLLAQYQHDVLLLEHGVLDRSPPDTTAKAPIP